MDYTDGDDLVSGLSADFLGGMACDIQGTTLIPGAFTALQEELTLYPGGAGLPSWLNAGLASHTDFALYGSNNHYDALVNLSASVKKPCRDASVCFSPQESYTSSHTSATHLVALETTTPPFFPAQVALQHRPAFLAAAKPGAESVPGCLQSICSEGVSRGCGPGESPKIARSAITKPGFGPPAELPNKQALPLVPGTFPLSSPTASPFESSRQLSPGLGHAVTPRRDTARRCQSMGGGLPAHWGLSSTSRSGDFELPPWLPHPASHQRNSADSVVTAPTPAVRVAGDAGSLMTSGNASACCTPAASVSQEAYPSPLPRTSMQQQHPHHPHHPHHPPYAPAPSPFQQPPLPQQQQPHPLYHYYNPDPPSLLQLPPPLPPQQQPSPAQPQSLQPYQHPHHHQLNNPNPQQKQQQQQLGLQLPRQGPEWLAAAEPSSPSSYHLAPTRSDQQPSRSTGATMAMCGLDLNTGCGEAGVLQTAGSVTFPTSSNVFAPSCQPQNATSPKAPRRLKPTRNSSSNNNDVVDADADAATATAVADNKDNDNSCNRAGSGSACALDSTVGNNGHVSGQPATARWMQGAKVAAPDVGPSEESHEDPVATTTVAATTTAVATATIPASALAPTSAPAQSAVGGRSGASATAAAAGAAAKEVPGMEEEAQAVPAAAAAAACTYPDPVAVTVGPHNSRQPGKKRGRDPGHQHPRLAWGRGDDDDDDSDAKQRRSGLGRAATQRGGEDAEEGASPAIFGVLHPSRYMAGVDCIMTGGVFVSRSRFEKLGGSPMAKWYRSIRIVTTGEQLGIWLKRHNLPVFTGKSRQRRPRNAEAVSRDESDGEAAAEPDLGGGDGGASRGGGGDASVSASAGLRNGPVAKAPQITPAAAAAAAASDGYDSEGEADCPVASPREQQQQPEQAAASARLGRMPSKTRRLSSGAVPAILDAGKATDDVIAPLPEAAVLPTTPPALILSGAQGPQSPGCSGREAALAALRGPLELQGTAPPVTCAAHDMQLAMIKREGDSPAPIWNQALLGSAAVVTNLDAACRTIGTAAARPSGSFDAPTPSTSPRAASAPADDATIQQQPQRPPEITPRQPAATGVDVRQAVPLVAPCSPSRLPATAPVAVAASEYWRGASPIISLLATAAVAAPDDSAAVDLVSARATAPKPEANASCFRSDISQEAVTAAAMAAAMEAAAVAQRQLHGMYSGGVQRPPAAPEQAAAGAIATAAAVTAAVGAATLPADAPPVALPLPGDITLSPRGRHAGAPTGRRGFSGGGAGLGADGALSLPYTLPCAAAAPWEAEASAAACAGPGLANPWGASYGMLPPPLPPPLQQRRQPQRQGHLQTGGFLQLQTQAQARDQLEGHAALAAEAYAHVEAKMQMQTPPGGHPGGWQFGTAGTLQAAGSLSLLQPLPPPQPQPPEGHAQSQPQPNPPQDGLRRTQQQERQQQSPGPLVLACAAPNGIHFAAGNDQQPQAAALSSPRQQQQQQQQQASPNALQPAQTGSAAFALAAESSAPVPEPMLRSALMPVAATAQHRLLAETAEGPASPGRAPHPPPGYWSYYPYPGFAVRSAGSARALYRNPYARECLPHTVTPGMPLLPTLPPPHGCYYPSPYYRRAQGVYRRLYAVSASCTHEAPPPYKYGNVHGVLPLMYGTSTSRHPGLDHGGHEGGTYAPMPPSESTAPGVVVEDAVISSPPPPPLEVTGLSPPTVMGRGEGGRASGGDARRIGATAFLPAARVAAVPAPPASAQTLGDRERDAGHAAWAAPPQPAQALPLHAVHLPCPGSSGRTLCPQEQQQLLPLGGAVTVAVNGAPDAVLSSGQHAAMTLPTVGAWHPGGRGGSMEASAEDSGAGSVVAAGAADCLIDAAWFNASWGLDDGDVVLPAA